MSQISDTGETQGKLPLYRKLLLTAAIAGNDACVAFEQLYQVPLLQLLGLPATLVSLFPLITGPSAMILTHLLGYVSDKGSNHQKRKMAVVVINSAIIVLGISTLIVANLLLMSEINVGMTNGSNSVLFGPGCAAANGSFVNAELSNHSTLLANVVLEDISVLSFNVDVTTGEMTSSASNKDAVTIPLTAVLGIMGFCLMDTGYDANLASSRSCVLACSPTVDHTSILILALVMAAVGGCINNVFGILDIPGILGIVTADSLVVQTTGQLVVVCFVLIVCLASTITAAYHNIKLLGTDYTNLHNNSIHHQKTEYGTIVNEQNQNQPCCTTSTDSHNEETIFASGVNQAESALGQRHERKLSDEEYPSECSPLAPQDRDGNSEPSDFLLSPMKDFDTKGKTSSLTCFKLTKNKVNFVIACVSLYLGASVFYSYNLFTADFLGKVVMDGDSTAAKGSAELEAYEKGVGIAAGGLLVFYCSYLALSIVHSKLLNWWGLKVDFCLSHTIMATAILSLTLSERVEVFYIVNVLYGFQRSAMLSVPFIIADNQIQSEDNRTDRSVVAKMIGIVSCMIPLNYCTVFVISGPLITLTQYDGAPLVLACVSCYLAALAFLVYTP